MSRPTLNLLRSISFAGVLLALPLAADPARGTRNELPDLEFVHPLEGPVHISGSFGEYRKFSRYHHGLDYKTFNRNGLVVRTPLAGVVERVHVSRRGYGNGLFLLSPGGVRTTYGHLNDFLCPGAAGTKRAALEDLRRAIEFLTYHRGVFIKIPTWFRFQSGECIARSGESGSGAPHLHFEVQKNGRYIDPLFLRGMEIPDTSPPTMLSLYVEDARGVQRLPVRLRSEPPESDQTESSAVQPKFEASVEAGTETPAEPRRVYYELDPDARLEWTPGKWVRYLVGGYDTMAARNRNGLRSMTLSVDGRETFRHELDAILRRDLARSGRVYHTARTVIGREYVYLLYPGGPRSGFSHRSSAPIRVSLGDASGNQAILETTLPAGPDAIRAADSNEGSGARVALRPIAAGRSTVLETSGPRASLRVTFGPRSLHEDARAGLSISDRLPVAARKNVRVLRSDRGRAEISNPAPKDPAASDASKAPVYQLEGPVVTLTGRDLFYRSGARAEAWFQAESSDAEGTVALYVYHETVGRWLLLAYPYREEQGRMYYRFPFRYEGSLAQLRDLSPPRILQPSLWKPPTLYSENKSEIVREFMVIDRGSGFSRANTQVLLDGRAMPFQWIPDRAALQVRLPPAMIPDRGVMLSVRAGDHSGNFSPWQFDFLAPPPR
ncbi:MAG: M23 family metallopeptidase [bacterium]|nr:M23 family metallopeptidase [bacterium]